MTLRSVMLEMLLGMFSFVVAKGEVCVSVEPGL
jgi:hypothetical protein